MSMTTAEGEPCGAIICQPAEDRIPTLHQEQGGTRAHRLLLRFAGQGGSCVLLGATGGHASWQIRRNLLFAINLCT